MVKLISNYGALYRCTHIVDLITYFVMTIATASFKTLSPNTNILRVGLTSRAWNIARVATGSTADMRAPNVKLKRGKRDGGMRQERKERWK